MLSLFSNRPSLADKLPERNHRLFWGLHICLTGRIGFFTGKPQCEQEVSVIRRMAPIHLIVYFPKTKEGKEALAKRAADVHAASVHRRLKALNCPTAQKLELLDAIIETVRKRFQTQSPSDSQ